MTSEQGRRCWQELLRKRIDHSHLRCAMTLGAVPLQAAMAPHEIRYLTINMPRGHAGTLVGTRGWRTLTRSFRGAQSLRSGSDYWWPRRTDHAEVVGELRQQRRGWQSRSGPSVVRARLPGGQALPHVHAVDVLSVRVRAEQVKRETADHRKALSMARGD